MRGVIQRVSSASVTVDGEIVASIGQGLLCLVGVSRDDRSDLDDKQWISRKILNLRLWPDDKDRAWSKSVKDLSGEILVVSQFTLYANCSKNKPDFRHAMNPTEAEKLLDEVVGLLRKGYQAEKVKTGVFGAMMQVSLVNDGPVTIELDSFQRRMRTPGDSRFHGGDESKADGGGGGAGKKGKKKAGKKAKGSPGAPPSAAAPAPSAGAGAGDAAATGTDGGATAAPEAAATAAASLESEVVEPAAAAVEAAASEA